MSESIGWREGKKWKDGNGWCVKKGKTRLKQNTRMPWKSKCEDPAILTHPHSYPHHTDFTLPLRHCCLMNILWMLLHFLFIPREYFFFRWFLRLSPLCRNVYALIMNCFSARIPTELKLFNFPYFLLALFYSQARLLISLHECIYTFAIGGSVIVSLLKFLLCDSLINFTF